LDEERAFGVEGSFFAFERVARSVGFSSGPDGSPQLAGPFRNQTTGNETSLATSFPGSLAGAVFAGATLRLEGWDVDALARVCRRPGGLPGQVYALAGFRSIDLLESFSVNERTAPLINGVTAIQGMPINPPGVLGVFDRFKTANQFYGPQLGAR